jgi:glycerophosphoryl diester phosphodiesterase
VEPIRRPPIAFAHRGASAHAPENTLEAFRLALKLGATGLESDVWLTADGVPVLDHDGIVWKGPRRRPIAALERAELPEWIPSLAELYADCGTGYELSLDVKNPDAAEPVLVAALAAGAVERLWLCHPDWVQVAEWRALSPTVRLVDSTRIRKVKEGAERRAASLAEAGIDAINMHYTDWSGGLTTLFHRFERLAFAWDAQFERILVSMLRIGVDAVYSNHVDRMVEAVHPRT